VAPPDDNDKKRPPGYPSSTPVPPVIPPPLRPPAPSSPGSIRPPIPSSVPGSMRPPAPSRPGSIPPSRGSSPPGSGTPSRPPPTDPRKPASLHDAIAEARAIAGGTASKPPPPPTVQGRRSVLLVDDDAAFRARVAKELAPFYDVHEAADGLAAAELCSKIPPPNLIVSDVTMPRLDGFSLMRLLKGHPQLRTVPFVFLSAKTSPQDVMQGIGLGARQYIAKSPNLGEIVGKLRKLLG
jgi:CheY-like chemotaxis protein